MLLTNLLTYFLVFGSIRLLSFLFDEVCPAGLDSLLLDLGRPGWASHLPPGLLRSGLGAPLPTGALALPPQDVGPLPSRRGSCWRLADLGRLGCQALPSGRPSCRQQRAHRLSLAPISPESSLVLAGRAAGACTSLGLPPEGGWPRSSPHCRTLPPSFSAAWVALFSCSAWDRARTHSLLSAACKAVQAAAAYSSLGARLRRLCFLAGVPPSSSAAIGSCPARGHPGSQPAASRPISPWRTNWRGLAHS